MPRPPRAKVASRVAKPTKPKAAPAAKEQAKPIPAHTKKPTETTTSFSEDSDGLVTNSRSTRSRRKMPWEKTPEFHDEAELTMTGALPAEEQQALASSSNNRTPVSSASKRARTTRSSARKSTGKTSPAGTAQRDVQAESPHVEEDSGFGDLTFSSLDSNSPAHGTRPPSAIKVGATPAHETSILALTNFKRRARQPSLLRMVQQTTDVEDNDDDDSLDNTENLDFDDFLPHAESTPLNVRRHVPEEETRNDSGTHVSSSGSRGRKRKLSPVVQVPQSSPPVSPQSGRGSESPRSPSPSLPEVVPSREEVVEQSQEDHEPMSETLASPLSSTPLHELSRPPPSPTQARPRRRGRPAKTPVNDEESDGEETETPAKAKRAAKKKAAQSISTAQLKDLLPRRRNRLRDRDEFDLESSESVEQADSDEDELQMPQRRIRQRQGAGKLASPKATTKTARGKKAAPGKASKAAQKASRTYSRRISSDKENEAGAQAEAETTEVSAIEHSEKLAAIRKKFEEVDAFELEFEDVDPTTSSSPFR